MENSFQKNADLNQQDVARKGYSRTGTRPFPSNYQKKLT